MERNKEKEEVRHNERKTRGGGEGGGIWSEALAESGTVPRVTQRETTP